MEKLVKENAKVLVTLTIGLCYMLSIPSDSIREMESF